VRRLPLLLTPLLVLPLLLTACSDTRKQDKAVVVGAYPFEWLVRQVVGDQVRVVNLVEPGVEPHDVELTPRQVAEAQEGVVLTLKGFQPALDDLEHYTDLGDAVGLDPITTDGARDPHVWLDPIRMKALAGYVQHVLSSELSMISADDGRLRALDERLDQLDADIRAELKDCRTREVVTSHAAFAYFAQRYGLTQRGITGLSPESEPSPKRLAEVADYAREHHVGTIFFESLVSPKVAETVASEVGAKTAVLDPIESVTGTDDYLSVMRRNAATLHGALGCA
jgi:zinc transport system substrate-binding protein